jgi:hypothetical protein
MNIDWRKAPDDAIGAFYRFDESRRGLFFVRSKDFSTFQGRPGFQGHKAGEARDEGYHVFIEFWEFAERPAASKWNGPEDGLPPVGTACEVDYYETWQHCEIIAHFQQRVGMVAAFTVERADGAKSLDAFVADNFRPLRTPEQIAAEERERAVMEIYERANKQGCSVLSMLMEAYDAGCLKVDS